MARGTPSSAAEPAMTLFISALKDDDHAVRSGAANALGNIGVAARDAVLGLIEALKDDEVFVRG